jgi:hypothetical protein
MECTRWVLDALRKRYPATEANVPGGGPWTCLEEFRNIDLLAFAAWSTPTPRVTGVTQPIVGHEVKVSRSDYRRELLKPTKRRRAVKRCNQFFFVVPKGLLTKEELAWVEPEHHADGSAFARVPCPASPKCRRMEKHWHGGRGYVPPTTTKTGHWVPVPYAIGDTYCNLAWRWTDGEERRVIPTEDDEGKSTTTDWSPKPVAPPGTIHQRWVVCEACEGRGYMEKSVVEQEAPTLWVPNDVGLIEVNEEGKCRAQRKAPIRTHEETQGHWSLGDIVRFASYHGDPRHIEARVQRRLALDGVR